MSGRVMGSVFGLDLRPIELLVLLAYCDHIPNDDDAGAVYPSARLLSWKTRLTVREIRKITKRLVELKLLIPLSANSGGYKNASRYRVNPSAVPHLPYERGEQYSPLTDERGERHDTVGVNSTPRGVNSTTERGERLFTLIGKESVISIGKESVSSSSATTDDDDLALTLTWISSACPRLTKEQVTELALLVARIPVGHQREWCELALGTMAGMEVDSPFRWLRRVLSNALTDGKAPASGNGKNGHTAPALDDAAALKAYYTPAGYEGIVEH